MIHDELRRTMITGTDATAICGLNGFKTEADVYLAKKFPEMVTPPTGKKKQRLEMGNRYEPLIAEMYSEKLHANIYKPTPATFVSPKWGWLGGSPDFLWNGKTRGVECKKVSSERYYHEKGAWGPDGTDQVPHEYLLQCSHYMLLCGIKEWDLAALIGDSDFRVYRLYVDIELCTMLIQRETEFFKKYIEGDEEPRFNNDDIANFLKKKYPTQSGATIEVHPADIDIKNALEKLVATRADLKASKETAEGAKLAVQQIMKDAGELIWEKSDDKNQKPLKITWKASRDGTKVDWKTVALRALDASSLTPEQREALMKDHSEVKPGQRRFLVYGEEDDEE